MVRMLNILKTIFIFLIYFLHAAIILEVVKKCGINSKYMQSIIMLLGSIIICFLYILIYRKTIKKDLLDIRKKENEKPYLKDTFKIWFIGFLLMMVANLVIGIFISGIAPNEEANRELLSDLYIYAIPTMVLFAPICEEIIFRLSFKDIIESKYPYIIVSGFLFGYVHIIGESGLNLLFMIPYVLLGICFSYLYEKHSNIICPIIAHIVHNLVCIMLIVLL